MKTDTSRINKVSFAVILIAWISLFPHSAFAQYFPDTNAASLKGVKSFDARFLALSWMDVTTDRSVFRENGLRAFELALRRDGVVVSSGAPNYLTCELQASENNGLVTYVHEVAFWDFNATGLHILLWSDGGIGTVGANNFKADSIAQLCADNFANAWLAQNPPA